VIEPRLWFARAVGGEGDAMRGHSLACVVSHFANEGTCIYERLNADGSGLEAFEIGTWRVTSHDIGSVLSLEYPDNHVVDEAACAALMADLCQQGLAETYAS
jgi:hypothetical protein